MGLGHRRTSRSRNSRAWGLTPILHPSLLPGIGLGALTSRRGISYRAPFLASLYYPLRPSKLFLGFN